MRLVPAQVEAVAWRVRHHLGRGAQTWVFGSRLRDDARGGDLDLYVEAGAHGLLDELRCKMELEDILGLPVDLIVRPPGDESPIAVIAKTKGVRL